MAKRNLSILIGILTVGASIIACSDDKNDADEGESGAQGIQEPTETGGSSTVAGTGDGGGSAPVAGTGKSGPVAGTGGDEPEAGTGGDEPEAGAGGDEPEAGAGKSEPEGPITCTGDQVPVDGQCVDRKVPDYLETGWVRIDPGEPTTCVHGDPYSFYVRKGTINKLLLFLQGGGACWDELTCLLAGVGYTTLATAPGTSGIFDPNNAENPFRDWYLVFAPYCSGDVFFGDSTQDFGGGPMEFKGFVNMTVIREWITENITAPEFIFVSGCSAGAVGVTLHGAYLARSYKDNQMVDGAMVTDSFQGIIPDGFVGLDNWGVPANFPDWLPELESIQEPYPADIMARGIKEALALPEFSGYIAANFNFANDAVQATYYGLMGGLDDLSVAIPETVHDLYAARPDNYRYYTAPGTEHCVFESPGVYDIEVEGTRLIDWLGDIANNVDVTSVEP
ncbi:MAG: hypothetical protein JXA30_11785 [Deltaproteobacteria bacterium]|nr:hypothetical protein [Deltaproteobacteria bacterium]